MIVLKRLVFGLLIAVVGTAHANANGESEPFVPSWMTIDADGQKVTMQVTALYNGNNGGWNFNGFYDGSLTVVVPVGWTVVIEFATRDAQVPHSLVVTESYPEDDFPDKAGGRDAAIKRAYTKSPDRGLKPPGNDRVRFKAKEAGSYYFFCGVVSHGLTGMWTRFQVSDTAEAPYAMIDEARIDPADQEGWK